MPQNSFLITGGLVFDGTGADPRPADVLVEGNRIIKVSPPGAIALNDVRVIDADGAFVMPGLVESHAHLGFGSTVDRPDSVRDLPRDEKLLRCVLAGRVLLDYGFTSAYSAGNRQPEHDVLLRSEFEIGWFPGPRLRAASWEGSARMLSGEDQDQPTDVAGAARFVHDMADLGVDTVKVSLSGESGTVPYSSRSLIFSEEEIEAIVEAARVRKVWLSAHAHAAEAVKRAARYGFKMIYHATWTDEEGMDLLEARKDNVFIAPAPGINWANVNEHNAPPATEQEETIAQVKQVMPELKRRGVRVLPGGDYGFFWNPIGKNARDLQLFVEWFGFTPSEALVAATKWGGEAMDMPVGLIKEGYLADLLLVDSNPLNDISVLADKNNIALVMKDGKLHKDPTARANVLEHA